MTAIEQALTFEAKSTGTITDFKYSPNGQSLAVADSEGYVQIYGKKDGKNWAKVSEFKADEGSIWCLAWADGRYGNLIGVGSFRNKVAIFQEAGNAWKEIAYHELHTASVNWVEFAQFGLKLYAGSSDGQMSILQLYHKAWKCQALPVGESAIATFALQQFPLGQTIDEENHEKIYPRIATVSKDQKIKIWAHECEKLYDEKSQIFEQKAKSVNKTGYVLVRELATPKETIRTILWRPTWGSIQGSLAFAPLITCSQQGQVKSVKLSIPNPEGDRIQVLLQSENQITKISQSLTGNLLTVSAVNKNQQETLVYQEIEEDQWKVVKKGKL